MLDDPFRGAIHWSRLALSLGSLPAEDPGRGHRPAQSSNNDAALHRFSDQSFTIFLSYFLDATPMR